MRLTEQSWPFLVCRKIDANSRKNERTDVRALQAAGLDDGQILEANQIIGYFNYVNRCLNGLGVTTQGDVIGYYSDQGEL